MICSWKTNDLFHSIGGASCKKLVLRHFTSQPAEAPANLAQGFWLEHLHWRRLALRCLDGPSPSSSDTSQ
eukprot:1544401-Amphidinium_carterae.1